MEQALSKLRVSVLKSLNYPLKQLDRDKFVGIHMQFQIDQIGGHSAETIVGTV